MYLTNPAMRTGLFGPLDPDAEAFGHLVETAVFAQRFHDDAPLNYARWGSDDNEIDMIESSVALQPAVATEIKWTDAPARHPESLVGLLKFCRTNALTDCWVGTRTQLRECTIQGVRMRLWPTAALAFHYGMRGIRGHIATAVAHIAGAHGSEPGNGSSFRADGSLEKASWRSAVHLASRREFARTRVREHSKNNLPDVLARWAQRDGSERERPRTAQSFCVPKSEIAAQGYDLSLNRYKEVVHEAIEHRAPKVILADLGKLEVVIRQGIKELEGMLG